MDEWRFCYKKPRKGRSEFKKDDIYRPLKWGEGFELVLEFDEQHHCAYSDDTKKVVYITLTGELSASTIAQVATGGLSAWRKELYRKSVPKLLQKYKTRL